MYASMYLCIYVCVCVCVCVCSYIYIYIYIYVLLCVSSYYCICVRILLLYVSSHLDGFRGNDVHHHHAACFYMLDMQLQLCLLRQYLYLCTSKASNLRTCQHRRSGRIGHRHTALYSRRHRCLRILREGCEGFGGERRLGTRVRELYAACSPETYVAPYASATVGDRHNPVPSLDKLRG